MPLAEYRKKRDFSVTPEPAGRPKRGKHRALTFVVQKHAARNLHYDFRLEMEDVLRSWAVPKGPSPDPAEKRLAVHVEDHPLEYGDFEGVIPEGQYGGGTVLLWDRGTWEAVEGDPVRAYRDGKLKFRLDGEKLRGAWMLVRTRGRSGGGGEGRESWLLFKERDQEARPGSGDAILRERPESALSGRTIEEIAANPERVWESNRRATASPDLDPAGIPGARQAPLPREVAPQLATLASEAPAGDGWLHEIKYDGYRILAALEGGKARLWTRHAKDWTDRFAGVARAVPGLPARQALLDGEVVVVEPDGRTSFQALQNALGDQRLGGRDDNLVYFVFDLLYLDGWDLRGAALAERKRLLAALLEGDPGAGAVRLSDHVAGRGEEFFRHACAARLEGIVAKRADRPYRSGRNRDWLKVKCLDRCSTAMRRAVGLQ